MRGIDRQFPGGKNDVERTSRRRAEFVGEILELRGFSVEVTEDASFARVSGGPQDEMLRAAADLLPPGGCLAYVTCTLNPEENEGRIEGFVRAHPGLRLLRQAQSDPAEGLGEFFYGAVLKKD